MPNSRREAKLHTASSAAHLGAIRFPEPLHRLYVAREHDAAEDAAFAALAAPGARQDIEVLPLDPVLEDFNADLCAFGVASLAEQLRISLDI